jgi:hypothetical protein
MGPEWPTGPIESIFPCKEGKKSKQSKSSLVPLEYYMMEGSCQAPAIPTEDAADAGIRMFRRNSIQLTRPERTYNLYTRGFRSEMSIYLSTSLELPCCSWADSSTVLACQAPLIRCGSTQGQQTRVITYLKISASWPHME